MKYTSLYICWTIAKIHLDWSTILRLSQCRAIFRPFSQYLNWTDIMTELFDIYYYPVIRCQIRDGYVIIIKIANNFFFFKLLFRLVGFWKQGSTRTVILIRGITTVESSEYQIFITLVSFFEFININKVLFWISFEM